MSKKSGTPALDEDAFWDKAFACQICGKPHRYRALDSDNVMPRRYTWADPEDQHHYRTIIPVAMLNTLRAYMKEPPV